MIHRICNALNISNNPDIRRPEESLYEWRLRQMNARSDSDIERAHFIHELADQARACGDAVRQVRLFGICIDLADYLNRHLFDGTIDPSQATDLFVDMLTKHYEAAQSR